MSKILPYQFFDLPTNLDEPWIFLQGIIPIPTPPPLVTCSDDRVFIFQWSDVLHIILDHVNKDKTTTPRSNLHPTVVSLFIHTILSIRVDCTVLIHSLSSLALLTLCALLLFSIRWDKFKHSFININQVPSFDILHMRWVLYIVIVVVLVKFQRSFL